MLLKIIYINPQSYSNCPGRKMPPNCLTDFNEWVSLFYFSL